MDIIQHDDAPACADAERFIGYFHMTDGSATGICNVLKRVLFQDLSLENAYDGASIMGGSQGGMQAVMKDRLKEKGNTFVPNVHCPPHQLNLLFGQQSRISEIQEGNCRDGDTIRTMKVHNFSSPTPSLWSTDELRTLYIAF